MSKRLFNLMSSLGESISEDEPTAEDGQQPQQQQPSNIQIGECWTLKIEAEKKIIKIILFGVIYDINLYRKILTVLYGAAEDYTVHIYIWGPGGSIRTGCMLLEAMERCKATVVTHNLGMAASCCSLILSFGDKICIHDNAITMFHHAGLGMMESLHRMTTAVAHATNNVMNLFEKMKARGILKEEEIDQIINQGAEFYLTADEIRSRLSDYGLLYEGEED